MLSLHYDRVSSTSDLAQRIGVLNPGQPLLITARSQDAGRGRRGRSWVSPPGGAWFSVVWPAVGDPGVYEAAPVVVGLAVRDAVAGALGSGGGPGVEAGVEPPRLKWPNDVLVGDRKVAGVLCEQRVLGAGGAAAGGEPPALVIGVGINTNFRVRELGAALRQPVATLMELAGSPVHNGELIAACVGGIERAMRELEHRGIDPAVAERVNEHLAWRGHVVQLEGLGASVRGEVVGVDPGGRLMLRSDGRTLRVNAGEVTSLRTMPAVS